MISLINELINKNIKVAVNANELELSFDDQEIDQEILDKVRENRQELITFLNKYTANGRYESITPAPPAKSYPTSHAQKRLWVLSQFEGSSVAYNMPVSTVLNGSYEIDILIKAIHSVVDRHEILRTIFREDENGELCQQILSSEELNFQVTRKNCLGSANPQALAEEYVKEDSRRTFNLEEGPLIRAALIQLSSDQYLFYYNMHHIISDGWSMEILMKDIMAYYEAYKDGREPQLKELRVQYKDYTVWQLTQLEQNRYQQQKEYWLDRLAGPLPRLDLPTSKTRPPVMTHHGRRLKSYISPRIVERLKAFGKEQRGSLFISLLTAWNILFHKYLAQEDIIIGTLVAGREHADLENQLGYYVNTLALRNKIDPEEKITSFYKKVKNSVLSSYSNQMYPFDKLGEDLGLIRDLSRNPVVDVMLALHNIRTNRGRKKASGANINSSAFSEKIEDTGETYSKFFLEIDCWEEGDRILLDVRYNTDVYEKEMIMRLITHYKQLLSEILENPGCQIKQISFLVEEEKQKLLYAFNDTEAVYPRARSIIHLFENQASVNPDKVAVVYKNHRLTYGELNTLAGKYSKYLLKVYNLQPGDKIVVALEHDHHLMAVLIAVKKRGAVYVPLDPHTPEERAGYIKQHSESKGIIDNDVLAKMQFYASQTDDAGNAEMQLPANNIEFIIYTSGSTGRPKGVLLTSSGVLNRLNWMWKNYPFEPHEICCAKTSISFVDHIWEFFGPLLKGIPLIFYRKSELLDIPGFIESLQTQMVTRIVLVPSLLRAMLGYQKLCEQKLGRLNFWISSGEALKNKDVEKFYSTFRRSNVRLLNIYGSTEVTADATYFDTYNDHNPYKNFKLFEFSLKDEIEKTISSHSSSSKILSVSLEKLLQSNDFKGVDAAARLSADEYLSFLNSQILPGVVNVGSPTYMGHMTGPVPDIFRELNGLVTALNQNQVKIETSLVSTLVEKQVIGIFHNLVYAKEPGFYEKHVQDSRHPLGIATNGGTMSNLAALNYALNKALRKKDNFRGISEEGLVRAMKAYGYKKVVVMGSSWRHYSIGKALKILGLGKEAFMPLTFENKSIPEIREELMTQITKLREEKTLILGIVGIAGATESGNIDPLFALGEVAKMFGVHYHIDAAFGGAFLLDDVLKQKLEGIQSADSVSICAHKQLYLPMGLSICLFKDPGFAMASENNSSYQARKESCDLGKFTIEGSRNFMSLILHAAFHVFGKEGFAEVIRHNYYTAQHFAQLIQLSAEFELLYKPDLNIVLYRYIPRKLRGKEKFDDQELVAINEINQKIQKEQFNAGISFVSYTEIERSGNEIPNLVFRAVFMNPYTTHKDLEVMLDEQRSLAAKIERIPYIPSVQSDSKNISIGKPIENVKAYILDEFLNMLPVGVIGEICIGGDCISAGYINASEESKVRFIANPFVKGERLFRTGDLGRRLSDGNIEFVARKDDQVKIRGHRIEPVEIEHALLKHQELDNAVVVAWEVESGEMALAAYITSSEKQSAAKLRAFLKASLPSYMLPSYFVHLETLPLTASGKVDRKALSRPADCVLPDSVEYAIPETGIEQTLANIWMATLQKNDINLTDDFFELGGHSLKAARLIHDYQKEFGVKVELDDLFVHTTLASHSALIEKSAKTGYTEIGLAPPMENYPLSDAQRRLWILSQFDKESAAYHMPFEMELKGELDVAIFEGAIMAVIERHEILRTVFKEDSTGEVRQWVLDAKQINFKISYLDFSGQTQVNEKIKSYVDKEFNKPFDLECGPLMRAGLFRTGKERYIFYFNMHHIISDEVSLSLLKRDVLEYYQAILKKETTNLSELRIQYKDYAVWQLGNAETEKFKDLQRYWYAQLAGKLPALDLPGQKIRPKIQTYRGYNLETYIQAATCDRLKTFCAEQRGSLYMGTLAIWYILFQKHTGQNDIILGTPVAGRNHADLKNQIGCYFNTLALRLQVDPDRNFVEIFQKVKEVVLTGYKHQSYPFDKVVEDLKLHRVSSRNPVFDVMFSFHNGGENSADTAINDCERIMECGEAASKLDILINFAEYGKHIYFNVNYNVDVYEKPVMIELMKNYKRLLEELLKHPQERIKNIDYHKEAIRNLKIRNLQKLKSSAESLKIGMSERQEN